MAGRAKQEVRTHVLPKDAPEGMEFVDCKRSVGNGDAKVAGAVIRTLVPLSNAAGVVAAVKYLSRILSGDDGGAEYVAEAVRAAMVTSMVAQGNPEKISAVGSIVPRLSKLSTVDKGQVMGKMIEQYINDHPTQPSKAELNAFVADSFASLSL